MSEDQSKRAVDEQLDRFLALHKAEEGVAFQIMFEAFQRMKENNIPTLIMFKEVDRLSQCLVRDFIDGFHDKELSAGDVMGAVIEKNEMDITSKTCQRSD